MTELTPEEEAASARAAEQARLRKARREAKIKAGAASRLNTITGLGGGIQRGQSYHSCCSKSSQTHCPRRPRAGTNYSIFDNDGHKRPSRDYTCR